MIYCLSSRFFCGYSLFYICTFFFKNKSDTESTVSHPVIGTGPNYRFITEISNKKILGTGPDCGVNYSIKNSIDGQSIDV